MAEKGQKYFEYWADAWFDGETVAYIDHLLSTQVFIFDSRIHLSAMNAATCTLSEAQSHAVRAVLIL